MLTSTREKVVVALIAQGRGLESQPSRTHPAQPVNRADWRPARNSKSGSVRVRHCIGSVRGADARSMSSD
jgi:hypothetical protein